MKATEQYFPVVLFVMLYKVALLIEIVDERTVRVAIQIKAIEQHLPVVDLVVLFIRPGRVLPPP